MRIGELGRRTGVGTHLLRYYEVQGLLAPERAANGYRTYTDGALVTVARIRRLLAAGLSTDDIRYLLPCTTGAEPRLEPCAEVLDVLRAHLDELDERIGTLTRSRAALQDLVDTAERSAAAS